MIEDEVRGGDRREGECRKVAPLLGAYEDGALEPHVVIAVDEHVGGCATCRERIALDRAVRGSLKRVVRAAPPAEAMRSRFEAAVYAESARGAAKAAAVRRGPFGNAAFPIAAAAATLLGVGLARTGILNGAHVAAPSDSVTASDHGGNDVLGELMAVHSRPLPPERTDPKDVRAFEQYVGVPVRTVSARDGGARLVGGRMLPLHQERAAMLEYEVGAGAEKHRVSVFIYDPRQVHVHDDTLSPRAVGTSEVKYGRANGYSVAITERGGVGYAVASDLDTQRVAEFAAYMESDGN